jgi:uncharacterized phage infection (PIP) family protein YhgE
VPNGNVAQFIKEQLQRIFPEGNILTCTIKEKEIQEIGTDVKELGEVLDQVNEIKGNVNLVIEKTKEVGDDFKTIREIVKGIENGKTEIKDGLKNILEKGNTILANLTMIIETIKNLDKDRTKYGAEQIQIRAIRKGQIHHSFLQDKNILLSF